MILPYFSTNTLDVKAFLDLEPRLYAAFLSIIKCIIILEIVKGTLRCNFKCSAKKKFLNEQLAYRTYYSLMRWMNTIAENFSMHQASTGKMLYLICGTISSFQWSDEGFLFWEK